MKFKWALGSIATNEASGGEEIPVELFQTLKVDATMVLFSIPLATLTLDEKAALGHCIVSLLKGVGVFCSV